MSKISSDFSYWNTRIIRHHIIYHFENGGIGDGYYYGIHEVYYNKNNKPTAWSEDEVKICFNNYDDLLATLEHIQGAVERTVLELETIDNENGDLVDSGKTIDLFKEE